MSHDPLLLARIAETVGTPFYCYDAPTLRKRADRVRRAFPAADFYYSMKANPNRSVVETLRMAGLGCELCSLGELEIALAAGVLPRDMIFVGPAKGSVEVERALEVGVSVVVAESMEELDLVQSAAKAAGRRQAIALRINPAFTTASARLAMSGRATQFGIDSDRLDMALASIAAKPNLELHGLHVYMGSRILDYRAVADNTRRILALADEIAAKSGKRLSLVDLGGGFGVPYFAGEAELDLAALSVDLAEELARRRREHPQTRIVFELGRYLTASAGVFVTRVRSVKEVKGRRFAVCDGGSNCHSAAAGHGSALRKNFPVSVLGHAGNSTSKWTVTGPLCTPMDIIAQDVELPDPAPGDLICIHQSGAYGPSASPVHFLSFGHPAEVMVDDGQIRVVREADDLKHILAMQIPRMIDPLHVGKATTQKEEAYVPA